MNIPKEQSHFSHNALSHTFVPTRPPSSPGTRQIITPRRKTAQLRPKNRTRRKGVGQVHLLLYGPGHTDMERKLRRHPHGLLNFVQIGNTPPTPIPWRRIWCRSNTIMRNKENRSGKSVVLERRILLLLRCRLLCGRLLCRRFSCRLLCCCHGDPPPTGKGYIPCYS